MKNKQSIHHSVIMFAILNISCAGSEHLGERAAKILAKGLDTSSQNVVRGLEGTSQNLLNGLEAVSQNLSNSIINATPTLGANAAQFIGEAGKDISKNLAEGLATGLENGATKIGAEATQNIVKGFTPYAGAVVGIYAVKEVVYIGKDLYKYNYPDAKEIAEREDAKERIAAITTKRGFRECLMKNAKTQRNAIGIPVNCEECGHKYSMTAGRVEFQDMVETFKETYKNL